MKFLLDYTPYDYEYLWLTLKILLFGWHWFPQTIAAVDIISYLEIRNNSFFFFNEIAKMFVTMQNYCVYCIPNLTHIIRMRVTWARALADTNIYKSVVFQKYPNQLQFVRARIESASAERKMREGARESGRSYLRIMWLSSKHDLQMVKTITFFFWFALWEFVKCMVIIKKEGRERQEEKIKGKKKSTKVWVVS